jgi:PAS domain S-box-containing protein
MANLMRKVAKSRKSLISGGGFLFVLGFFLVALSVFLWKTQESRNLSQVYAQTESASRSYSRETEIRFNNIYNALNRLSNRGTPKEGTDADEWGKDAAFYIDSFMGIKSIAWVDKNLIIRRIEPLENNQTYINQKANEAFLDPSDVFLWVPLYKGTELGGFILGTIHLHTFISPVISDIKNIYMLQLSNEGKTVYISDNWKQPKDGYVVYQTITLQNTAVLNLTFAPTNKYLNSEIVNAQKTLWVSLLFSFITVLAVYFAQNYNALSKLNESRYRELLEDVQLVAVLLDTSGRITFCNDYLLTLIGWKREEVLGQDWFEHFVPSDREQIQKEFLAALPKGTIPAQTESLIITRTGEQRWVMFNNTLLRDTRGMVVGTASLGEDITERKQLEQALKEINLHLEDQVEDRTRELRDAQEQLVRQERLAMLGQVAGSIGHELRNPLGVISNVVYLLKLSQPDADSKHMEYLDIIENETRTSVKIITDLLDFARIKSINRESASILPLVHQTLDRYPAPPSVDVALDIASDVQPVFADPQHVIQVLGNLVTNAFQAMPDGGKLTICAAAEGEMIKIAVRDTGVGIPYENISKLFEPLFTTKFKGIGLGLAVSKKLIEANGGRIEAASEPGYGSTFTVFLPAQDDASG